MLTRRRVVAVAVAAVLMTVGLVGAATAQTSATDRVKAVTGVTIAKFDVVADEGEFDGECICPEDWEPSAQELAEINAETEALVEYLQRLGFEVAVAIDEFGMTYLDLEKEDEALFAAIDEFYSQMFADEVAGWSDEEKAEWNAEIDAFVAELEADGLTVETEEIAPGVYDIVWTEELEKAVWDLDDDMFFDEFEDWEPSPQELAEINAETEALVEYLQRLGFEVAVATDEFGMTYLDLEKEDEALFAAIDEFYSQMFADEVAGWSDEEKAEWNAEIEAFVAELEADGLTVETEEIAPGVVDIVWTEELEMSLWDPECEEGFFAEKLNDA